MVNCLTLWDLANIIEMMFFRRGGAWDYENDISTEEVQFKAKAALLYCKNATEYTTANGGKPWKYVLLSHNSVKLNMDLEHLVKEYEYKDC